MKRLHSLLRALPFAIAVGAYTGLAVTHTALERPEHRRLYSPYPYIGQAVHIAAELSQEYEHPKRPAEYPQSLDNLIAALGCRNIYTGEPLRNVRPDDPQRYGHYTYVAVPRVYYMNFDDDGYYVHAPVEYRANTAFYLVAYGPPALLGDDITGDGAPDNVVLFWHNPPYRCVPASVISKPWALVLADLGCLMGELDERDTEYVRDWHDDLAKLGIADE